jgi:hypothetical protein
MKPNGHNGECNYTREINEPYWNVRLRVYPQYVTSSGKQTDLYVTIIGAPNKDDAMDAAEFHVISMLPAEIVNHIPVALDCTPYRVSLRQRPEGSICRYGEHGEAWGKIPLNRQAISPSNSSAGWEDRGLK